MIQTLGKPPTFRPCGAEFPKNPGLGVFYPSHIPPFPREPEDNFYFTFSLRILC